MTHRALLVALACLVAIRTLGEERLVATRTLALTIDGSSGSVRSLIHRPTSTAWLARPTRIYRLGGATGSDRVAAKLSARTNENGEIQLALSLTNESAVRTPVRVTFPRLEGLAPGGDATRAAYCFPASGAVIDDAPRELRSHYGGLFPLQFLSVYNARRCGVYLLTHDRENHEKTFWLRKRSGTGVDMGVDWRERTLEPGATWTLPPAVIGGHRGDWHGALDAYRQWLATWDDPVASRPLWFREAFNFRQVFLHPNLGLDHGAFDPATRRVRLAEMVNQDIAAFGGVDFVHVFDWSQTPGAGRVGDYDPWTYLGGSRALRAEVETIERAGVPVGVYLEGYLVSRASVLARSGAAAWELRGTDGKAVERFGPSYRTLCPHVKPWREHLARASARVCETLGVRGVYLDEIGFGYQYPCHRDGHGHDVPSSQLRGEHELVAAVRAAIPESAVLYTEETPSDATARLLDGSLTYAISRGRQRVGDRPAINLTRFALPDLKTFEILRVDRPLGKDLAGVRQVFFNGEGIWLAGASHDETWFPVETRRLVARSRRILWRYRNAFTSDRVEPLVPTVGSGLFANRFGAGPEVVWTIFNGAAKRHSGPALGVAHFEGATYHDVWNERPASVEIDDGEAVISLDLGPRETGCVVRMDGRAEARVRGLGGHVFRRSGRVVEVVLNRCDVSDADLESVSTFPGLTDLSLEETGVGDAGMARLERLRNLEWLNLYRTRVGDAGLARVAKLPRLAHLPIGSTRVTDRGLAHLKAAHRLRYLGLRGNAVTDSGVAHLAGLVGLTALHLGETRITDRAIDHVAKLVRLEKLWIQETAVSDASVAALSRLRRLEELVLYGSRVTGEGVARLQSALPRCRVVTTSNEE